MVADPVYEAFLEVAAEDAPEIVAASDSLALSPAGTRVPPDTYEGTLVGVEHLVRVSDGTVAVSDEPIQFSITFPADYCRSADPRLPFRVVTTHTRVFHPNVCGGIVCLGVRFRPCTRLRPLVEHVYTIFAGPLFAPKDSLDPEASRYYLQNLDRIASLRARPLWRRAVARRVQVDVVVPPPRRGEP